MIHGAMHAELGDRGRCIMHTHQPYATALCGKSLSLSLSLSLCHIIQGDHSLIDIDVIVALASDSDEPNAPLQM